MRFYRKVTLICRHCRKRFYARDANGTVRNGAETVRDLLDNGVRQFCPKCKAEWHGKV